jgi:hypothetical protein
MGFADLHTHTVYSYDGTASVSGVLKRAKQTGLDIIAITDHDEINGALKALELAPKYGIEVIPGIEITTAEGDLLALNITEKVDRDLSLIDTVLKVHELGGFCIAPHPMSGGFSMKSLSAYSIMKALRNPQVAQTLLGIETYNATALDRMSNHYAHILAEHLGIAKLGNSDAHVAEAIGLGVTEFEGRTAKDLLKAIRKRKTIVRKKKEWTSIRILGSWVANYMGRPFVRLADTA